MTTDRPSPQPEPRRRSLTDRRFLRVIGVVIILSGVAFAYSLAFTDFQERVQFQWEFRSGERVPITHVTCPTPWSVVVEDAQPEGVVSGDLCVLPSRGHLAQAAGTLVIALAVGIWVLTRNPQRRPMPELPPSVRALLSKK